MPSSFIISLFKIILFYHTVQHQKATGQILTEFPNEETKLYFQIRSNKRYFYLWEETNYFYVF